jgi:hypothetical protein
MACEAALAVITGFGGLSPSAAMPSILSDMILELVRINRFAASRAVFPSYRLVLDLTALRSVSIRPLHLIVSDADCDDT